MTANPISTVRARARVRPNTGYASYASCFEKTVTKSMPVKAMNDRGGHFDFAEGGGCGPAGVHRSQWE